MEERKERSVMRLLQKGKRSLISSVFSRMGLIVALLLLQLGLLFCIFFWFSEFIPHLFGSTMVFNALIVMLLLNSRTDPSAKLTWLIVIMVMPVFGVLLYLYTRSDIGHRALRERAKAVIRETEGLIDQPESVTERLRAQDAGAAALTHYVARNGSQPVFENTAVTYFPSGEKKLDALLPALEKAEHFIFLEYFIIREGEMWGQVLNILAKKAAEGLDVRVMIDGTCEFTTLSHDYPERVRALGIKCKMFAPAAPFVSTHYNYRDHRKIAVIDGHTGFTGGVNLADEYINREVRFGHWKDTAIMLQGEAVRSLTLMFLQMWGINERMAGTARFLAYPATPPAPCAGFVQPYADCPLDGDKVGERVYMDILYRAKKYVHIMTPYLILDSSMENALLYAAERGVDVHLILPGIPDKKYAWWLARTHYAALIASGVKISEYTPGFVHAKVFVADDCEAVVGTINLDYRSLYHHFECAAYLYGVSCIPEIEQDFQDTLAQCHLMTQKDLKNIPWRQRLAGAALKAIAPLM